ncbi:unnamed protein product [Prunus armeniaca]
MPLATDVEWWTQYSHDSKRDESSTSVSRKMKHVPKESKYEAMTSSARNASSLKKNRRLPSVVVNPSPSETSFAERNVGEKTKPKGVALSSFTRVEHFLDVVIGNKNVHGMRDILDILLKSFVEKLKTHNLPQVCLCQAWFISLEVKSHQLSSFIEISTSVE